jgi:hypothetical protein
MTNKYQATTTTQAQPVVEAPRQSEYSFLADLVGGAKLQAAQALISGAIAAALFLVLALTFRWYRWYMYPLWAFVIVTAAVWSLTMGRYFAVTKLRWMQAFTVAAPQAAPAPPPDRVLIDLASSRNGNRRIQRLEIPCDEEQLKELAAGILNGTTLAEANWTGKGKTFGLPSFRKLRAYLASSGLATQNDKTGAWEMTQDGLDFLERYLERVI